MRHNLGQVIQCESHVTTRLRYVLKSGETSGSQSRVVTLQVYTQRYEYVTNVSIELNAPNGALTTNDTVSGEDSMPVKERLSVVKET